MIRRSLGRGLGALIEEAPAPEGAGPASMELEVDRIVPSRFQPRTHFDPERLRELADAIIAQGVIEPLIVRRRTDGDGSPYELIAGERRLRAARMAGLVTVPAIVREIDDRAALEMSLVENLVREELSAVEEARALVRLAQDFALSHEQIAGRIGKSRPYVSNAIRLLELPEEVLAMIARGELSAGQARPLLALPSAAERSAAARRIASQRISARGAEQIASLRRNPAKSNGASADPHVQALADSLQRALKRKIRVVRRRGKAPGRIEIEFYGDDDLTALAAMLTGAPHQAAAATFP